MIFKQKEASNIYIFSIFAIILNTIYFIKMEIKIIKQITDEVIEGLQILLPQLSPSATSIPDNNHLKKVINSESITLFIAEEDNKIVGTLTLAIYPTPLTQKAWIEDVVTDNAIRGKGIGKLLIEAALDHAKKLGIEKVDLTSSNDRIAAHGLYKKTGFDKRDTTVFRKYL